MALRLRVDNGASEFDYCCRQRHRRARRFVVRRGSTGQQPHAGSTCSGARLHGPHPATGGTYLFSVKVASTLGVVTILDKKLPNMQLEPFMLSSEQSAHGNGLYKFSTTLDAHAGQGVGVAR